MKILSRLFAALIIIAAAIWIFHAIDVSAVINQDRKLPIYNVQTSEKKVAISFDAAWGDDKTMDILDNLDKYNVKATFFLVKFWAEKYPQDVKEIQKRGHEIGNHSATHPDMTGLTSEKISSELKGTSDVIQKITGQKTTLFRPPFGAYDNHVIETCEAEGYKVIQWSVDSLDWKDISTEQIVERVTRNVKSGDIILFHNNAEQVSEYLPLVLKSLQDQGFQIVPVGQLIYYKDYHMDHAGKQCVL
nr:polysaccharide deacetylase family sporulation protein PdaB [uncultured Aminipila sp.]